MIRGAAPLCSARARAAVAARRSLPAASACRGGSLSSSAGCSSSASIIMGGAAAAPSAQLRFAGGGTWASGLLSTVGWKSNRKTMDEDQLREELPHVFAEQPIEVDDYIRPEKTYFEKLEDLWDWVLSFASPVDKQVEWMRALHTGFDLSYGSIFFLWGLSVRLITLYPMMYAHRNTLRMGRCQNLTSDITNNISRVKNDKNLSTPERRVMTDGYKRMEKAVYKKHKCHKYGSFITALATPVLISAFMSVRRMAAYEDDLESANFLWITDLTMPDPTMILPLCCTGLFLANFEANQALNRGGRSAMSLYMRWGVRVGCLGFTYYFASQPACLFAYWIGLSTAGMLQPTLLRSPAFRERFDFPPLSKTAALHDEKSPLRWVMAKLKREDLAAAAAKAREEEEAKSKRFETIDDVDIVFEEDEAPKKGGAAAAAAKKAAASSGGKSA